MTARFASTLTAQAAALVRDTVLIRYLGASALALAADLALFLALIALGAPAAPASAAGYSLGILAHWWVSSRLVFVAGVAPGGVARARQKALFVVSALVGLALTTGIVGAAAAAGLDPRGAKLIAILAAFTATWLMRERIVFRA